MATSADSGHRPTTWSGLFTVALCALGSVFAVDRVLTRRYPPKIQTEVEEGVEDFLSIDPTVLVIGSSHARTFEVMDRHLAQRTGGRERIAAVAVEFGKLSSYAWVFEHRILPELERAPRLSRFILVTEWWDSIPDEETGRRRGSDERAGYLSYNVPSRAWTAPHFALDYLQHGLTDFNRNYLNQRFIRLFGDSVLVRDRGHRRMIDQMQGHDVDGPLSPEVYDQRVADWVRVTAEMGERIEHESEMAALGRMLDLARAADLETTILLYPRKPDTFGERMLEVTLPRFSDDMRALCRGRGLRFVDYTLSSPLGNADFAKDFDHILPEGNERFSAWALDGELSFLTTPRP